MVEILLKDGFQLNYTKTKVDDFTSNEVYNIVDITGRTALVCLDSEIQGGYLTKMIATKDDRFICLEGALETTKKVNLKHYLKDRINAV